VIWVVLSILAVGGLLSAVLVWINALQVVKSTAAAHAESEIKLKDQLRISRKLMQMRDSSLQTITASGLAVTRAFQEKEKLNAADVRFLKALLDLIKVETTLGRNQLDTIEQDARRHLDGDQLKETLGDIKESQAYLERLDQAHDQFEAQVQQVFGNPAGKGAALDKALKDAYKMVEDALNKLDKENKEKKEDKP
jgi:hypothetical protein